MADIKNLTIADIRRGLAARTFSASEIAKAYLARIAEKDPEVHAYLSINEEGALAAAKAVDDALAAGRPAGALAGVPFAIKDNMLVEGGITTAASKILETYRASYDAHVIRRLKQEHAMILGKANLDEFAMGTTTENSAFGVTKNPHDTSRVAGGSSGGSVAAVAADTAVAALGSDTGGSIRMPAGLCGVVGMKPTYGAVSRSGIIAMASSLDQVGPITKTVEDAAAVFDAIRGKDPLDATSVDHDYGDELRTLSPERGRTLTVGIPEEYFIDGLDPAVANGMDAVMEDLKRMGVTLTKISLPHTKYALPCYYIVQPAEVSSNLARYDGIRYARRTLGASHIANVKDLYFAERGAGFGPEAKRRIMLGTFVLSSGYYDAYYGKAQAVRRLVRRDFEEAFKEVDVILTPTSPTPAWKIGEKAADPLAMYLADIFTVSLNLAGLPGIAIPVRGVKGLPIGFQLIGRWFREADILNLGLAYEKGPA